MGLRAQPLTEGHNISGKTNPSQMQAVAKVNRTNRTLAQDGVKGNHQLSKPERVRMSCVVANKRTGHTYEQATWERHWAHTLVSPTNSSVSNR